MANVADWPLGLTPKKAALVPVTLLTAYGAWTAFKLAQWTRPEVQRDLIHERNVERVPQLITQSVDPFEKIDDPIHHGMAPFAVRNVWLTAKDGSKVHGWHTLPLSSYRKLRKDNPSRSFPDEVFEEAIKERPTVLFLHGTGWTLAAPRRVRAYSLIASRLDCNVLSIDYRGYGLSPGVPTEPNCFEDARMAWDYLAGILKQVSPEKKPNEMIAVLGHSLGGCIAADLVMNLQKEGTSPRCLMINGSPTSIKEYLADSPYPPFVSIRRRLGAIGLKRYFLDAIAEPFSLEERLRTIECPVLLTHTTGDALVSESHFHKLTAILQEGRAEVPVTTAEVADRFTVKHYPSGGTRGELITWRGDAGGHSDFVGTEVVIDMLGEIMHL